MLTMMVMKIRINSSQGAFVWIVWPKGKITRELIMIDRIQKNGAASEDTMVVRFFNTCALSANLALKLESSYRAFARALIALSRRSLFDRLRTTSGIASTFG